jgi:hypothetical protein
MDEVVDYVQKQRMLENRHPILRDPRAKLFWET